MTDAVPSRGEFDLLREIVTSNGASVGVVAGLSVQVADVIKDVSELRADVVARFDRLNVQRDDELRQRRVGRRWLIGTGLAGLSAMGAVLGSLAELLTRVHG